MLLDPPTRQEFIIKASEARHLYGQTYAERLNTQAMFDDVITAVQAVGKLDPDEIHAILTPIQKMITGYDMRLQAIQQVVQLYTQCAEEATN